MTTHPVLTRTDHQASGTGVSLTRLHLLRSGYLLIGVGLVLVKWPELVQHEHPWPLFESVVTCMLVALSLLAFLGLRYPLQMLPVMLFEITWKLIWMGVVAAPRWAAGGLDAATTDIFFSCALVVVIVAVVPWRYVIAQYAAKPGERWRPRT